MVERGNRGEGLGLSGNMHMVLANKLIGVGVKMVKCCLFCGDCQLHIPFKLSPFNCF